jgi:sulfur-carrier protein
MAKLIIPTPLRKFTESQGSFLSQGVTVRDVINDLITKYTGLKPHLIDDQGNIRSFIRIYVGEDDIQSLNQESTRVDPNTVVSIIPAIAGGIS